MLTRIQQEDIFKIYTTLPQLFLILLFFLSKTEIFMLINRFKSLEAEVIKPVITLKY